ncbi:MAG TPA: hypothetical protein VGM92_09100, partial [Candidatus Kapabacteria bacterium]
MKLRTAFFILTAALLLGSALDATVVSAQNSATGTSSATLIKPIAISLLTGMDFGSIIPNPGGPSAVSVSHDPSSRGVLGAFAGHSFGPAT